MHTLDLCDGRVQEWGGAHMNGITRRKPPSKVTKSRQYDLFAEFFGNSGELSNTIELWDAIPKYAVSARRQAAMRQQQGGRLEVHEYRFEHKDRALRLEIQPASLKVDGKFVTFYPSADEELVEEVIRKAFADQRYGMHDAPSVESWVRFSLQMIRKELKARGRTRSLDEIKRSIEILARTTISLFVGEEQTPIYTNPILSDLTRVNRSQYLEDTSSMWVARLPALISKSVNDLSYRQFNYGTYMALPTQLARWLHKLLSHRYVQAGLMHDYTVLFSTIRRDSGLLEANRITKNLETLNAALDELVAHEVLLFWEADERRGARNKIVDVLYSLKAHPAFIKDVKAANARSRDARAIASGRPLVPGSRRSGQNVVGGGDQK